MSQTVMIREHDSRIPVWLEARISPLQTGELPRVMNIAPEGYAGYAKVFHRVFIDLSVKDKTLTWESIKSFEQSWEYGSSKDEPLEIWLAKMANESKLIRTNRPPCNQDIQIRWKQLLEKHSRNFHAEVNGETLRRLFPGGAWPCFLIGPEEGTLDLGTCETLVALLEPLCIGETCSFYYSRPATRKFEPILLRAELNDIRQTFQVNEVYGSPTYWVPDNKAWCVCSDPDQPFTIVAGSQELVEAVCSHPDIEALPVTLQMRVDLDADQVNITA